MVSKYMSQHPVLKHFVDELKLISCVAGIYFFFLAYAYFQERLQVESYGENKEHFANVSFLLCVMCSINAVCSWFVLKILEWKGLEKPDTTPVKKYFMVSATALAAMFTSNLSLNYVDYPTQVLAKSCKPIPVMLMGLVAFKKKYSLSKYICVGMITTGIMLFFFKQKGEGETTLIGQLLLLASLAMDGFTGPFQENLFKEYHPTSSHLMFFNNFWQTIIMSIVLVITGDGVRGVEFCVRNPDVIQDILSFSISAFFGQIFIFYSLHQFGALVCSTVTTTRKFFTILFSCIWFGHSLNTRKMAGVALVFAGLTLDMANHYLDKGKRKKDDDDAKKNTNDDQHQKKDH